MDKKPRKPSDILQNLPQAEVDETQKIVLDWFGEDKLPEGLAERLAKLMTVNPQHSPFETAPIKVDTGSEIVRNWFEDEPAKLVQYYKAQAEPILHKISGADITELKKRGNMSRGLKIFVWSFVYVGIGAFHYLAMAYVPAFWTFDDWVRDNLKWFVQHFGSDLIDGLVF